MDARQTAIAQRSQRQLVFAHPDMDYYFSWIVGRQIYGGSDEAECLEVAERITSGDPNSWHREWLQLAERIEAQAEAASSAGHTQAARDAFLRACSYYRAPLFIMRPDDPAFRDLCHAMHRCFERAAPACDPPVEPISAPFRGQQLPGYFWKAEGHDQPRPTLVVIGGIETFAEDCYFMIGPAGARRGYHVLTVDLPGQGLTPDAGLSFEARMGPAVQAMLAAAIQRPEVDAERLALFGFSWGGHVVFKGAQHDQQQGQLIRALIANPAMPDVFRAARAQQSQHSRRDHISGIVIRQIAWRMGLRISAHPRDLLRRLHKAYDYLRFGKVDPRQIACPTLCLAGAGEAPITLEVARACIAQLPHPLKQLVIFTAEQGGEAHCQVNNLALPNQVIFDWLDTVFR